MISFVLRLSAIFMASLALAASPAHPQPAPVHRAIVERVEWEVSDAGARVIVVVKGKVGYSTHTAGADASKGLPPRAYVDLKPARLGSTITQKPIPVNDRLVRRIRIGQFREDTARIVVDLAQPAFFHVTTADRPARLILKLVPPRIVRPTTTPRVASAEAAPRATPRTRRPPPRETASPRPTPRNRTPSPRETASPRPTPLPTPSPSPKPTPSPTASPSPTVSPRRFTVVIDPGHGGQDPGARGVTGDEEKVLTLAIAKEVARRLEEDASIEVVLTRTSDESVSLEQRTAVANAQGADLFVSIHANASESSTAAGVETYTLNNTDDRATMRLAALENGLAFTGAGPSDGADETDLAFILSDLLQTGKEDESIALAEAVQGNLVRYLQDKWRSVPDLGVKKGPFYVLVGAYMPCVLVEVGFLTNPTEGQRIASARYQRDIAEGIRRGIRAFIASSGTSANL